METLLEKLHNHIANRISSIEDCTREDIREEIARIRLHGDPRTSLFYLELYRCILDEIAGDMEGTLGANSYTELVRIKARFIKSLIGDYCDYNE